MFTQLLNKIPLIRNRTKILISFSLLLLATTLCLIHHNSFDSILCLVAMFFSFLGDIMLNIMPLKKRPHWLLYTGAIFFMISHIIYALAYNYLIHVFSEKFINRGAYVAYMIMICILITTIGCIFKMHKSLKPSMIFVFIIYILINSINFITIYSYSYSFKAFSFIGATSFLISDYIIGIENIFKLKSDTLRKLVWIFYPIGQFLILTCR